MFIIAEAGVNHNGDIRLAQKLIEAAKAAGADAVKFQTFKAERLVTENAPKADYQKKTTLKNESQFSMLKKLELSFADHKVLFDTCRKKKIIFISSPFDQESADLLAALGVKILKIPSGEITNTPFLTYLAKKGQPLILSTGMSTLEEVKQAVSILSKAGKSRLALLHCVSQYPAPFNQVNLMAIPTLAKNFDVPIGFSDHTMGVEAAIGAVVLGARIIEKHLTLDRKMKGPDHKVSLTPDEFRYMVECIRHVEQALGNGIKKPAACERDTRRMVRKSIVAAVAIREGEKFSAGNLTVKRPGYGIAANRWSMILGTKAKRDFQENELIEV